MRSLHREWLGLIVALVSLVAAGCGGNTTFPVEGKVVFKDGTPLHGGLVMFELVGDDAAKTCARGDIQPDGTFRLSTFKRNDGALPGRHRVSVTQPLPKGRESELGKRIIHRRFEDYDTSQLEFTIERGKNQITIEVERP
jgi:hypothetical protein